VRNELLNIFEINSEKIEYFDCPETKKKKIKKNVFLDIKGNWYTMILRQKLGNLNAKWNFDKVYKAENVIG